MDQEVWGSILGLAATISEIGYLLLPCCDMAERSLKQHKSSKQPTSQPCDLFLVFYFQSSTDFSCSHTPRGPAHLHEEPVVRNGVHNERPESADGDPEENESHDDEVGGLVNGAALVRS